MGRGGKSTASSTFRAAVYFSHMYTRSVATEEGEAFPKKDVMHKGGICTVVSE